MSRKNILNFEGNHLHDFSKSKVTNRDWSRAQFFVLFFVKMKKLDFFSKLTTNCSKRMFEVTIVIIEETHNRMAKPIYLKKSFL